MAYHFRWAIAVFEFAEKLTSILPKDIDSVFFTNSGSEAVDTALKIALAYFSSQGMGSKKILIGRSWIS